MHFPLDMERCREANRQTERGRETMKKKDDDDEEEGFMHSLQWTRQPFPRHPCSYVLATSVLYPKPLLL